MIQRKYNLTLEKFRRKVYDDCITNRRTRMMQARMNGKFYYYALYLICRA